MSEWGDGPGQRGPEWRFTRIELVLIVVSWFALGYVVGSIVR